MRHRVAFGLIALLGVSLDLFSKHLVFAQMTVGEEIVIVENFFEFGKTTNRGIVFGQFATASRIWLWVSLAAIPIILAIFLSLKKPRWVMTASLALILGGTIGNMYDRLTEGAVRDFIKFYYPALVDWIRQGGTIAMKPWPLFNIADSCICVGVILLSLEMLFFDEKKKKSPSPAPTPVEAAPIATAPTEPIAPPSPDTSADPSAKTEPSPLSDSPPAP